MNLIIIAIIHIFETLCAMKLCIIYVSSQCVHKFEFQCIIVYITLE